MSGHAHMRAGYVRQSTITAACGVTRQGARARREPLRPRANKVDACLPTRPPGDCRSAAGF
ncbi:hypothetical protein BJD12_14305 [Xanthomonas vesicatoria ATCC 35937]|uniref:Uncharacterized protein n=2 Tax=Xanthomonas vesicatoria TaxID=56460 RepID=A0AAJ0IYY6_9XANT|nr:hypothetical protein BI313_17310 [Xanthomonas vesicatoria]APP76201.1 hypothetical protein BJD12_14305 [Xanthomonas vesicatoria ATCC 35937]EGD11099.1 hypothetical protein XVE_0658 [Xanthomonas vesicatoria ATCC 35937]KHM95108.1 hypothetical protein OR61_09785 [Xanthomonas vesicatoria]KHM96525.1 hypothetical protein OR60_05555 [Xanthomonas vesicatoria]